MEQYLTVSQLTKYISRKFEFDPYLERVYLKGEISNYNARRRGMHQYFNLKDEGAIISAVLFAGSAKKIRFEIEEGMGVMATGRVAVYERGGNYQIIIDALQPDGIGALYLAYEQTKEKLKREGLFDVARKKTLPKYPKRIGVLTSPSGAVIQDILTTVQRRFPIAEIVLFPTIVQGEKSADSIVANLQRAEAKKDLDVIIIGRGGGSFEDLFSFNEEKVIRALASAKTPVISSVGHETDTTLADLVADLRAPTPTAAAEMAVPVLAEEILKLEEFEQRLIRAFQAILQQLKGQMTTLTQSVVLRQPARLYDGYLQSVDQLETRLVAEVAAHVQESQQTLRLLNQRLISYPVKTTLHEKKMTVDYTLQKLQQALNNYLKERNFKVNQAIQGLEHLSPLKILRRGYAVVESAGQLVHSVKDVQQGDELQIQLDDGKLGAVIENISENKEQRDDGKRKNI